ncbi:MAG: cache domain-containing protein [Magnetospirillum sp.]|nr:cache domain-containing protein [Magnetospirillum sp.]
MIVRTLAAALVGIGLLWAHPSQAVMGGSGSAAEAEAVTYEDTKAFVDEAVAFMKKVGPEKAFAAFNDPKGKWIKGELYIFVFNMKGVYLASGFGPERTGTNAWKMADATGQLMVVQEIIKRAKRDGAGTVDYLWKNPATGKLQNKTSYVVRVDDTVVGAGYYHR